MSISELIDASLVEEVGNTTLGNVSVPALLAAAADTAGAAYSSVQAVEYELSSSGAATVEEDWGDGETLAAFNQMLAQNEKTDTVWILKRSAAVATVKTMTFSGPLSTGHGVSFVINGQTGSVTYATSNAATLTALAAAIQALDGINTASSNGTDTITITGDAEWPLSVSASTSGTTPPTVTIATTTAGNHAADDVAAALAEEATNKWYGLAAVDTDNGVILSAAAGVEGNRKFFWFRTNEAGAKSNGDTTNIASYIAAKNYRCSLGFWTATLDEYINAAAMVHYFATPPGQIALANSHLQGVTADTLTASEVSTLKARYMNTYRSFSPTDSAFDLVRDGVRSDGKRAEATRDLDYLLNEIEVEGLLFSVSSKKPTYDQPGLDTWRSSLVQLAQRMGNEGVLRTDAEADQSIEVIVPKFADINPSNKALFKFAGCRILGQLKNGVLQVDATAEVRIV